MCARIALVRPLRGVGAHDVFRRTWGSRQTQDIARPRPEALPCRQNAKVFSGVSKGLVLAQALVVIQQGCRSRLTFDLKNVHGPAGQDLGKELGSVLLTAGMAIPTTALRGCQSFVDRLGHVLALKKDVGRKDVAGDQPL